MAYLTLLETASLLNVSKETLRNWDKAGKLNSVRNPLNNYRTYRVEDVKAIFDRIQIDQSTEFGSGTDVTGQSVGTSINDVTAGALRRSLTKIHKVLRDTEGNSSLIERFDEVSKLIFLKLTSEKNHRYERLFFSPPSETSEAYALRLREAFESVASSNKKLFPIKFNTLRLGHTALAAAGRILSEIELVKEGGDAKGYAYEEMIRNTFDKGENQQFFTPQPVVDFMVGLVGDHVKGVVCDPACGTGGFLVALSKQASQYDELVGLEIDERLAWITGLNLLVHDAKKFQAKALVNGGSLGAQGRKLAKQFDVMLTNPPFGSDFSDRAELDSYLLGKGKNSRRRGVLFIERCLQLLKPGGILAIVIDDGVLSQPSTADVREMIINQSELLAVISLPDVTFMPYASVSTSILLVRRRKGRKTRSATFYARSEKVGRKANGEADIVYTNTGETRLNNDLPDILDAWLAFEESGCIPHQTDNIFIANLSVSSSSGHSHSKSNRLDFLYHHPSRVAAQVALSHSAFPLACLGDIATVRNESIVPSADMPDQVIMYTGLANIESYTGISHQVQTQANSLSSGVKKYYKGDIIFAKMRPNLRKVALIETDQCGYASGECVVLTPTKRDDKFIIEPFLLAILLRSDFVFGQIIHLITGIGRPRITLKDLLAVRIPIPPEAHQIALIESFLMARKQYKRLLKESRQLECAAKQMESDSLKAIATGFVTNKLT